LLEIGTKRPLKEFEEGETGKLSDDYSCRLKSQSVASYG